MKNLFFIILYFMLLCFYCGCNNANGPDYPPGAIKGRVLDSATHKPIVRASVITIPASNLTCATDSGGYFLLGGIPMPSSAVNAHVIASATNYYNDTVGCIIYSEDTTIINFVLAPTNGIYIIDNIHIQEYVNQNSYNSLDLNLLRTTVSNSYVRDLDLIDTSETTQRFLFVDASSSGQIPMSYTTLIGNNLGNFTKSEFDTLTMYYGAGEPLSESDFPKKSTDFFYPNLTDGPVFPFYLKGRFNINPQAPKMFGLLYIKSTYLDPNNIFNVIIDIKINKNGQNYFVFN